VSCSFPGDCAAAGNGLYPDSAIAGGDAHVPFVVDETFGSWGDAIEVPGLATLNVGLVAAASSISCSMPGDCGAGGVYADGSTTAKPSSRMRPMASGATRSRFGLVVDQHWRRRVVLDLLPIERRVRGAGQYADALGNGQAFVANEVNGAWAT